MYANASTSNTVRLQHNILLDQPLQHIYTELLQPVATIPLNTSICLLGFVFSCSILQNLIFYQNFCHFSTSIYSSSHIVLVVTRKGIVCFPYSPAHLFFSLLLHLFYISIPIYYRMQLSADQNNYS